MPPRCVKLQKTRGSVRCLRGRQNPLYLPYLRLHSLLLTVQTLQCVRNHLLDLPYHPFSSFDERAMSHQKSAYQLIHELQAFALHGRALLGCRPIPQNLEFGGLDTNSSQYYIIVHTHCITFLHLLLLYSCFPVIRLTI